MVLSKINDSNTQQVLNFSDDSVKISHWIFIIFTKC